MSRAEQPQDLRCPKKLAEVTSKGIVIKCRGCEQDVVIPFAELRSMEGVAHGADAYGRLSLTTWLERSR